MRFLTLSGAPPAGPPAKKSTEMKAKRSHVNRVISNLQIGRISPPHAHGLHQGKQRAPITLTKEETKADLVKSSHIL